MARPPFGTDGLRGVANVELTPELALAVGRAVARIIPAPLFLVGRDTRRSGPLLQAALSAGMASEGADVLDVGVLPTPGVAFLAEQRQAPGAVLSASHNPYADNGIKLFDVGGTKLPVDTEVALERELDALIADPDRPPRRPVGQGLGGIVTDPAVAGEYRHHLRSAISGRRLEGLRVVLDGANGAASVVAPEVFAALGATVHALNCEPDGVNINEHCGSTDPGDLQRLVVEEGAHLGLAFDGDADRLVAVDDGGTAIDGDQLLALFAEDLRSRDELAGNTVVVTVMSNLGLRLALAARGIEVAETPVGDRNVLAALESGGWSLGGEQSGHIVFRDRATTGDGILTAIVLGDLVVRQQRSLAELVDGLIDRVPQVLVNVRAVDPWGLVEAEPVRRAVAEVAERLGEKGRVLVRASGTEPLVRIMVEAVLEEDATSAADHLAEVVSGVRQRSED